MVYSAEERDLLLATGYAQKLHDSEQNMWLMEQGINQLEDALRKLIGDPSDRRIIVCAWRPHEFDQMALPLVICIIGLLVLTIRVC